MWTIYDQLVLNITDDSVMKVSIQLLQYIMWTTRANSCWLGLQHWGFLSSALHFKVQPAPYFHIHAHMGKKKGKVLPQGKATDWPSPRRDAWLRRMAVSAANLQPVTGATSKKKPLPAGRHRWDEAESRPSSLRFIDSFRPGAVTHNGSRGETDNSFMRDVTLRLFLPGSRANKFSLHKHTHSGAGESKTRWNQKQPKRWGVYSI